MVAIQRLALSLGLCLHASATFKIYKASDLEDHSVSDACVKAMSADIACHEHIHSFVQPRYRGSLHNVTLTDQICTGTCSTSLRSWFNTVVDACADEDYGGGVPQRYGGYIWNGWNETCVKDPKTKKYCNDIIDEFTELEDGEEMPRDELCHICYRRRLAIMQSSSYSIYDHFYQSQLEKVYKTCGGSGPTEIPPPPQVEKPEEYCLTNKYHITQEGDTCDSIARANPGVAGVYLYMGNQELIGDCNKLPAGLKLCLPMTCPIYVVKPGDTCWSIERSLKVIEDTVEDYNSWINVDCSNLQKATDFYGKPICIGHFGAGSRSASSDAVAKTPLKFSSANGPAVVLMEPPEKAEVADGTTLKCGLWHTIKKGESCADICKAYEICKEDVMYEINPTMSRNNNECTKNLVPGEALCVAPIAGWDITYESTGPAQDL